MRFPQGYNLDEIKLPTLNLPQLQMPQLPSMEEIKTDIKIGLAAGAAVVEAAIKLPSALQQAGSTSPPADNTPRSTLPRAPNGDYLPDPAAQGPHTTLGTRTGSDGKPYTQGATFDKDGKFTGRTDVTDHGRPQNHENPHFHPATSSNGVGPGQPIPNN
jgi:hypothetical protein